MVGYWDYDAEDGLHVPAGLVVREVAGAALGFRWHRHLELAAHGQLVPRPRNLWPVELNRAARRVCINYPDYPRYGGRVDFPGTADDGVYQFGPCPDRPPLVALP